MQFYISSAEKEYVRDGVQMNVRGDGRVNSSFRAVDIEDQVFPHVHGSSKVSIGDSTDVLCSVKISVGEPKVDARAQGILDIGIDVSQHTNVKLDERQMMDYGNNLAQILQSLLIDSGSLDLEDFCIIEGKYCWILHIDVIVLQYDGCILDAASIAILNALNRAKIPITRKIIGESGFEEDFEVSGSMEDTVNINTSKMPLCITVVKIGSHLVMDPTNLELMCASGQLVIAIDERGECCGVHKLLGGIFCLDDINKAMVMATEASVGLHSHVKAVALNTTGISTQYPEIPPSRIGLLA